MKVSVAARIDQPAKRFVSSLTERVFVREWAHYRYGVFNEAGYPGDPLYPPYRAPTGSSETTDVVLTSCTDQPLELDWRSVAYLFNQPILKNVDHSHRSMRAKLQTYPK